MPPSNPKQKTRKFGMGGEGHLFPVPRLWGWHMCPPSFILLMLPLQIPCSLVVAKLMSNSCPLIHRPDPEKLKRELQSLECCHAPHMGTLPKLQEDNRKCKIIVTNKAFESQGRGTLLFSLYVGSGPASTVHPKINIRNFKHPKNIRKGDVH